MTQASDMQDCIQKCDDCRQSCLSTLTRCLEQGGRHAESSHVLLLADCAEICQTAANFMSRGSDFHQDTCGVCGDVCDACAESCDAFADDEDMRSCADACRECAQSCRQMARIAA